MKKWKVLSSNKKIDSEEEVTGELFKLRGIDKNNKDAFLHPDINSLNITSAGISKTEIDKAKKRINRAIENNEKIVILGDYDVDGICASAILWETIYKKYKNVFPYIPDRFTEGYGISVKSIDNLLNDYPDTKLIITVDNGVIAEKAVDYAKEKEAEVIITDHHVAGEKYPEAKAVVHTTNLCGAGVAWLLSKELNFLDENEINEKLELAALATVVDLVPLISSNRTIVKLGLKYLQKTKRPGLLEIYNLAGIEKSKLSTYHIGYIIGPRLNATGRLFHAMDSLRLLCSFDALFTSKKAKILEDTNKKRQKMVLDSTEHAKITVTEKEAIGKIILVHHESYSEGVVGLISSRLVEQYYRPSLAISVGEKISKGSARSIAGVNIIELLRSVSHILEEVGGHPMAAGFSLKTSRIEEFNEALQQKMEEVEDEIFERVLNIDLELPDKLITKSLHKKIQELSPFGMGNHEPIFATYDLEVVNKRLMGRDGSHVKFQLSKENRKFEAIGFGIADKYDINVGDKINIAYNIDLNLWNGNETLQMKIKDIKTPEVHEK